MGGMVRQQFESAQDVRPFLKGSGQLSVIDMNGASVGRAVFNPGWRWSEHVGPIAGTELCQAAHAGYVLSGRLAVRMDDGTEEEFGAGDTMLVDPGHDAWVVGNEPCIMLDWQGYADFAKPR